MPSPRPCRPRTSRDHCGAARRSERRRRGCRRAHGHLGPGHRGLQQAQQAQHHRRRIDLRTAALAATFHDISAAPLAQLQAYSAQSDALAAQADHASGAALKGLRDQFDTLAWLFKQTSDILLPLGKEQVLLKQYRRNLASWHASAQKQYHQALAALGVRLGIVAGLLAVVFALGEVWRRAVLRYVHDLHRRYQLLLVRTIVVWTHCARR